MGSRHPEKVSGLTPPPPQPPASEDFSPARALLAGAQKYTMIPVPVLAVYALLQRLGPEFGADPATRAAAQARQLALASAQANAFEIGVPSARVVRLPNADHNVLRSNEADVLREMKLFISTLQ